MALKATIYKASLQVSDVDRNHYRDYQLTLARHPSETEERLMIRMLAFALHADEQLEFTRGLCVDEEPELWLKNPVGEIELWIELGLPDENRLRKACSRAEQVILYCYGGRAVPPWWQRNAEKLARFGNLRLVTLPEATTAALTALAQRNMELHASIQAGQIFFGAGEQTVLVEPEPLQ